MNTSPSWRKNLRILWRLTDLGLFYVESKPIDAHVILLASGFRVVGRDLHETIDFLAFNAKYIAEALESAIAQTWDRNEIIVVNDGGSSST